MEARRIMTEYHGHALALAEKPSDRGCHREHGPGPRHVTLLRPCVAESASTELPASCGWENPLACDLWLVPLVDVLCHSPDNPFAEEIAAYDKALTDAGLPPVPVYSYMPGLTGDVAPVAGFDYEALHFLRRAHLLQLRGLEVTPVDELGGDYEQLLEMFETAGPAVPPGVALRPRGRLRPRRLRRPAGRRRAARRRRPAGLQPRTAARTGGRGTVPGHRPGNPPPAPPPPSRPTDLEEPAASPIDYGDGPFARERHVWLGLHAAATRSLAQGSMIVFS